MKKLIPALCMLLVAAALLGTSTFAWFSMNREVQATGMQISANSDSVYLLIGSGDADTYGEIQTAGTTTTALTVDANAAKVLPSAHVTIANTAAATATNVTHLTGYQHKTETETKISVSDYEDLDDSAKQDYEEIRTGASTNWYYKIADATNASASTKDPSYLTSLNGYVIHKTCYVTLAKGSNTASNLVVSNMTIASNGTSSADGKTFAPVRVLVTTDSAAIELNPTKLSDNTPLAATVTDSAVVQVDIFIYYDGADEAVFTENIAKLDGASINLTFSVG